MFLTLNISSKWRNIQNWENIPLKTSTSFFSSCSTNASSFPQNSSMALSKTRVSNARGPPRGTQMPNPRAAIRLRMSHLWDWQSEQIPRGCLGRGERGWALLELTDALYFVNKIYFNTQLLLCYLLKQYKAGHFWSARRSKRINPLKITLATQFLYRNKNEMLRFPASSLAAQFRPQRHRYETFISRMLCLSNSRDLSKPSSTFRGSYN